MELSSILAPMEEITSNDGYCTADHRDVPQTLARARLLALSLMPAKHDVPVQSFHSSSSSCSPEREKRSYSPPSRHDSVVGDNSPSPPPTTTIKHERPQELQMPAIRAAPSPPVVRAPVPAARVAIPRAPSRGSPPFSYGPMSSLVTVPPRPRPGRKPIMHEDAADRRRTQNRLAQRNFRDKRQQKLAETQAELNAAKQMHQAEVDALAREMDRLRQEVWEMRRHLHVAPAPMNVGQVA